MSCKQQWVTDNHVLELSGGKMKFLLDISPFKEFTNCKSNNRPQNGDDDRGYWNISDTVYR